jgi:short-subunit dehydrogenase involved in D-alanine esterification of teichoic acids
MSDITKDDVQRAVQDSMRDMASNINRMRDQVERIDQRTNDLDESQREIRDLSQKIQQIYPQLEVLVRNANELDNLRMGIEDVKLRTQNIERGMQQITAYLQAQHQTAQQEQGYSKG